MVVEIMRTKVQHIQKHEFRYSQTMKVNNWQLLRYDMYLVILCYFNLIKAKEYTVTNLHSNNIRV